MKVIARIPVLSNRGIFIMMFQHITPEFVNSAITNQLLEKLTLQFPIFAAPIGSLVSCALLKKVAENGGMGFYPATWKSASVYQQELSAIIKEISNHHFGINFVVCQIKPTDLQDKIKFALSQGIKNFSFSWGDLKDHPDIVALIKKNQGIIFHTVGDLGQALAAIKATADILIVQGTEAGGHVLGKKSLTELVKEIIPLANPRQIPVIATGGIAHGSQMKSLLDLGAAGIQMGTAFIVAEESLAHEIYKETLTKTQSIDQLILTDRVFTKDWKAPLRVVRTEAVNNYLQDSKATGAVIAWTANGDPLTEGSDMPPLQKMTGKIEKLAFYAGTGITFGLQQKPVTAIMQQFLQEYRQALIGNPQKKLQDPVKEDPQKNHKIPRAKL